VALILIEEKEDLQVIDENINEHDQVINLNFDKNIYTKKIT
jgi:hypothetical protein